MIAREGLTIIFCTGVLAVLLGLVSMVAPGLWRMLLWLIAILLVGFVLYFFRDPQRTPPEGAHALVLAPADGKVVAVEEVYEPHYLEGSARQISIFLSPLNVHVNRVPVDGVIEYEAYMPGKYLVAWHPKASEKNERSLLGLRHPGGDRVLFKQIAGAVARRIVYHLSVGDSCQAGDRFGIIKLGSRMDVLVPLSVTTEVDVGDRVQAGETVLGRFADEAASY